MRVKIQRAILFDKDDTLVPLVPGESEWRMYSACCIMKSARDVRPGRSRKSPQACRRDSNAFGYPRRLVEVDLPIKRISAHA